MDTSIKYINMCEKAMKYLGKPNVYTAPYYDTTKHNLMNLLYLKECIPLYTQDQLQEMFPNTRWSSFYCFMNMAMETEKDYYLHTFESMEQFMLGIVMAGLHNKHWNENDWVEIKGV